MEMEQRTLASDHVICPGCSHDFPAVSQASRDRIAELEATLRVVMRHRQEIVDTVSHDAATEINAALHKSGMLEEVYGKQR
jgi:uncharacterized Zn finger protein (UPF0148 family)